LPFSRKLGNSDAIFSGSCSRRSGTNSPRVIDPATELPFLLNFRQRRCHFHGVPALLSSGDLAVAGLW
jgi:hypothetical protein